jgi:membrane fusion protein (multidrug efflux system)
MENKTSKGNRKALFVVVIILMASAGAGVFYWIRNAAYETTDDAQIKGNIYSVRGGVTAYLNKICFRDNQRVEKGDTLFVFDTAFLVARVMQARAALQNARAGLSISDIQSLSNLQHADASLQTALSGKDAIASANAQLTKAQNDFSRDEELLKINAITQVQYDGDKATLEQARASYIQSVHQQRAASLTSTGLKSQAEAAHHQITAAMALVEEREAALQLAEEELSHAFVLAPCTGIVTKRSVDESQYVLAGQSLCTVVDEQHLWITANFKETQLRKIKPGQSVNIRVDAYPGLELKGKVQSLGGATGDAFSLIPPDNATGNFIKVTQRFPARIQITSFSEANNKPDGQIDFTLFPGLSAFVKVKTNGSSN